MLLYVTKITEYNHMQTPLRKNENIVDVTAKGITKTTYLFNVQYYISYETYLHMMSKEHSYKNATIIYI